MKRQWIINDNHQLRIDDFVYRQNISKKLLKDIKMKGDILVNGVHQTVRYILQIGDVLTLIYPPEVNHIIPMNIPIHVIYEDDYLLIIDKQKGVPCIPTRHHYDDTLANGLSYYYQQIGLSSTIHFVNRLDKETAGLLLVAKYREIHDVMMKDLSHIHRRYQAHVLGKVEQGSISLPIYRHEKDMKRMIDERGKASCTHYQSLSYQNHISLVEFVLETGRTHQIRVHMSAIGHPLLGDCIYGHGEGEFDLESVMIAFVHPITKQIITIRKHKSVAQ